MIPKVVYQSVTKFKCNTHLPETALSYDVIKLLTTTNYLVTHYKLEGPHLSWRSCLACYCPGILSSSCYQLFHDRLTSNFSIVTLPSQVHTTFQLLNLLPIPSSKSMLKKAEDITEQVDQDCRVLLWVQFEHARENFADDVF